MSVATGYSPHYLLFGREMVLPTDIVNGVELNELNYSKNQLTDYADEMEYRFVRAYDAVKAKHAALQQSRDQNNVSIRNPKQYNVGDTVMVLFPNDMRSKLDSPWRGPYVVLERVSNVNYKLDFPDEDGRRPYSVVHVDRLKAYVAAAPARQ